MPVRSRIVATGRYLPERVVTNRDLAQWMDTSDDWIQQRTGIAERRWARDDQATSDLGVEAARAALAKARLTPEDLDAIVFATLVPDHQFPGSGVLLQAKLGVPEIPAIDIRNQCSGFLYGLSVADAWIRAGSFRRVLVVGAEKHSCGLDLSTRGRDVAVIFGDGAGAAILEPCDHAERGLLAVRIHADGREAKTLATLAPGSAFAPWHAWELPRDDRLFYPQMDGKKVFKHAVARMPEVMNEVLSAAGFKAEELDLFVPHQANLRISEMVQRVLGLADAQVIHTIQHTGNTTAASIPIALDEAVEQGRLREGNLVGMAAFGAGFTWGAALVRW